MTLVRKASRKVQRWKADRRRQGRKGTRRARFDWREHQAYIVLTLVFALVAVATVERIARRWRRASVLGVSATGPGGESVASDAFAAKAWTFFHPAWGVETRSFFPFKRERTPGATGELAADVARILHDPKGLIEREFKVPVGMRDRVLFWMQVHAVYNSRMRVVHDRTNPGIIYGYIDFRPLFRALGNTQVAESKSLDIERRILKELKAKLAVAANVAPAPAPETEDMSLDEKNAIRGFLSKIGALGAPEATLLIGNLRTQTGQSDEFLAALHRSKQLLPHIESVFRKQGLPISLGRIPFVESSFNTRAQSKVGAVGVWQFMPQTARQMIHADDEKAWADPVKQTIGAARMLKIFRSLVPDWGMAITSYNSGVGRIQKLVKKHKLRNVEALIALQADEGLGFAGKNFYAQFLSATLVEAYKEELFHRLLEPADYMLVLKDGQMPFPKESCPM